MSLHVVVQLCEHPSSHPVLHPPIHPVWQSEGDKLEICDIAGDDAEIIAPTTGNIFLAASLKNSLRD